MKKHLTRLVVAVLATATALTSLAACGEERTKDGKTIYIQASLGGYGSSWLTSLASQFEKTYEAEGYKVKVLTPSATMVGTVAMQDMYSNNAADIYFTGGLSLNQVVDGDYGTLVKDITDTVWNKPAIKFDGTEEDILIKDKIQIDDNAECSEIDGRRYSSYNINSIGGIIVNYAKLQKYGITELPKTTNELFDAFDKISKGANGMKGSSVTNIYPVTYLGGENGYFTHMLYCWFAQYSGTEAYEDAWNWNYLIDDAEAADKVMSDPGFEETIKALYKMYDLSYRAPGSSANKISTAHSKIMKSSEGAVFMADGEWAYNEIFTDYSSTISDLRFINIPVISSLGTKLFGANSLYNFDDAKCEELLRYIIDKTDEGKTSTEIVASAKSDKNVDVAENDVVSIMKARGVYCSRSKGGGNVYVCSKVSSEEEEICYKFLRMFASEDNAALNFTKTNSYTVFTDSYGNATTEYHKGYASILNQTYAYGVWEITYGYKKQLGQGALLPLANYNAVYNMLTQNITKKTDETDEVYAKAAKELMDKEKSYVKNNWQSWVDSAAK